MRHTYHRGILAIALALALSGCIKQTPVNTPPVPQSALQWTITYNAALAKATRAVEQAVETVQQSGAITVNQARPIIVACGKVAIASESVRAITSRGTEASWNVDGPKIRAILDQLAPNLLARAGLDNQTVELALSALTAAFTLLATVVAP